MVLALILVSSIYPSLVSVGLTILSHNLIYASLYRQKQRLQLGLAFMIVNILVLMEVVRQKRAKIFLQDVQEDPEYITALGINE